MRAFYLLLFVLAGGVGKRALAQVDPQVASEDPIHWAYAAYFGTGRYALDGLADTYVLSFTPGWEWRESEWDDSGRRQLGFRFRMPVAIGAHEFSPDVSLESFRLKSVNTISAVPGIEIEIPATERWTLRSLSYLGFGTELDGGASARLYWLGMRSQFKFELDETEIFLVNGLSRVGYSGEGEASSRIMPLSTGLEFRRQLANRKIGDEPVFLNWHVSYTKYLDELAFDFGGANTDPIQVASEWELGVAFSKGDQKLKLWRLSWDRVGLAYRFDPDGDFSGVSLVFQSLFDR